MHINLSYVERDVTSTIRKRHFALALHFQFQHTAQQYVERNA